MSTFVADITISLDGYVAGPDPTLEDPLGAGGEALHEWAYAAAAWQKSHGREGGEENADSDLIAERLEATGATIMGRKMFSGGDGPWDDDPRASGWWGDDPPFGHPVFVLTHHEREPLELGSTRFTFVTDGIEAAAAQAATAAGEKEVTVAGGAEAIRQFLDAGLLARLDLHISPILLGGGTPLFGDLGRDGASFQIERVVASPLATHIRYRVADSA